MTRTRILVRLPNWVGDMMMALPALGALRVAYPDARLVGMARPQHVELAERISFLDEVVSAAPVAGWKRMTAMWTSVRTLRRAGLDSVVLLTPSFEAALTAWLAGIPERVGNRTDHRGGLLTRAVAEPETHRVDGFLDLVAELGARPTHVDGAFVSDTPRGLELTPDDRAYAERLLVRSGLSHGAGDVGSIFVNPAAAKRPRAWSSDRFRLLAEALADRQPSVPVLVHDYPPFEVFDGWPARESIHVLRDASLVELAAVIERCSVYVGNDSGPMHIAAALGIPTVGIYGSSSPARTSPRGAPHVVVSARFDCSPCRERFFDECPSPPTADERPPCLDGVTVEMVLAAVDTVPRTRGRLR